MELELKREICDAWVQDTELALSSEESVETIVPDYCPDIGRVIETSGTVYIHSQELRGGTAEVTGAVRVCVLYTPDGERGIHTLEFSLPFTASAEARNLPEGAVLTAEAETEFLEIRPLNPRKLFTHCKLVIHLTPYRKASVTCVSDAVETEDIPLEKRLERRKAVVLTHVVRRDFVFSDALNLSPGRPGAAELLSSRVTSHVTEAKAIGNKLIVKGVSAVFLLYLTEDGDCGSAVGELPFSQILDLDAAPETPAVSAKLQQTDTDVRLGDDTDGRRIDVTLYFTAFGFVREERELTLLRDLYSTTRNVRYETEPLPVAALFEQETRRQNVRELLEIGVAADSLLSLSAFCGPVSVSREGKRCALRAGVHIRAMYLDEGGVPLVAERRSEVQCQADFPDSCYLTADAICPEEPQGSIGERGIETRFPVDFHIEAQRTAQIPCVVSAEWDESPLPDPGSEPSLILRRLGREENLWDLAKACRSTVSGILAANGLTEEADAVPDTLILIPGRRQAAS